MSNPWVIQLPADGFVPSRGYKLVDDFTEVKEDLSKAAKSGKDKFKEDMKDFASKASYKTEEAITFLEKQLAILKEKNKTLQQTS